MFELIVARQYEIKRSRVVLSDILGVGQFGDVFKGVYQETVKSRCILCYFRPTCSVVFLNF